MNPKEKQVSGNHYKEMKIQPIEFIQANELSFSQGNVVKYVCRYKQKNGIEDLKKAIHYCELMIEELKQEQRKVEEFQERAEELEHKFKETYEKAKKCCGKCDGTKI